MRLSICKILVAILLPFTLAACANSGNKVLSEETSQSISTKITKGDAKSKVRGTFGDPTEVTFSDSGAEVWKYVYARSHAKATNFIPIVNMVNSGAVGTKKLLVVRFGTHEKVTHYTFSENPFETNVGMIAG